MNSIQPFNSEPIDPRHPLFFERALGRLAGQLLYLEQSARWTKTAAEQGVDALVAADLQGICEALSRANALMEQLLRFKPVDKTWEL
jgi:hypothetical protein